LVKRQALQYQPDASIDTGPQLDAGTDTIPTSFEGWLDGNGVPPTLVTDSTAPSGQPVMQVTRNTAGGDYFSSWTAVTGGNTYCVSANIRWAGGSVPFVGIDTTGLVDWLMGSAYTDPVFGATRVVSATASGWQSLSRQIVMPAGATQARLSVELWDGEMKAGADEAYFDSVQIVSGSCAGSAPAGSWLDGSGVAATLVTDNTAPSGQPVIQVTRDTAGGDYFSPWTAVTGGNTYCVSANIRWVGGGIPFVGIDTTGTWVDWLMGAEYTDPLFGATTLVSATVSGWQSLSRQIVIPVGVTQARLSVELWGGQTKAGADEAYFDNVHIAAGGCWVDGSGVGVIVVPDSTAPSGQPVMQVTRHAVGGDYFSPWTAVTGGNTYCVSANIRWVGGSIPFVGIDTTGTWVDWLMGAEYTDPLFGATTVVSATASGWQSLSRQIVKPAGATQARLSIELWDGQTKAGADEAYFDSINVASGGCAGSAPPGSWVDGSEVAATLVTDSTAPSGQPVMQVTRNTAGGDYFSPWTAVTGGNTYCVSANIRWVGGGIPFVGIDTTGTWVDWLIGAAYTDSLFGPTTLVSATVSGWQSLSHQIVMPAVVTQARLSIELWAGQTKAGADEAYFDNVNIAAGSCPAISNPDAGIDVGTGTGTDTGTGTSGGRADASVDGGASSSDSSTSTADS